MNRLFLILMWFLVKVRLCDEFHITTCEGAFKVYGRKK